MKYFLALLFFYSIGIQASNFTSFQNDSISVSKTNHINTPIESDSDSELNMGESSGKERQSSFNLSLFLRFATVIIVFILGFICAIIYYNFKIRSILDVEFESYKNEYRSDRHGKFSFLMIGVIKILKDHKNGYKSHIRSQGNFTSEYNNPIGSNSKTNDNHLNEESSPTISWDQPSQQLDNLKESDENRLTILFFSAPEQDGSFSIENASVSSTSRSYYKLEYNEGDNLGKLMYRSGELDKSALSQMDYILGPVCDIENSSMSDPSVIHVESEGSVLKEGEFWQIKDKIKIKLS